VVWAAVVWDWRLSAIVLLVMAPEDWRVLVTSVEVVPLLNVAFTVPVESTAMISPVATLPPLEAGLFAHS